MVPTRASSRPSASVQRSRSSPTSVTAIPNYRVLSGEVEIGAGWNRRSESSGRDYVSLSLAAPELAPRRLYANLGRAAGEAEGRLAIIWNPAD